jgi:hypothetical protein
MTRTGSAFTVTAPAVVPASPVVSAPRTTG